CPQETGSSRRSRVSRGLDGGVEIVTGSVIRSPNGRRREGHDEAIRVGERDGGAQEQQRCRHIYSRQDLQALIHQRLLYHFALPPRDLRDREAGGSAPPASRRTSRVDRRTGANSPSFLYLVVAVGVGGVVRPVVCVGCCCS